LAICSNAAIVPLAARLYGSSFIPASGSPNSGMFFGFFDNVANTLNFYVVHNVSGVTTISFNSGNVTSNGPVLYSTSVSTNFINMTWTGLSANAFALTNNLIYFNISSTAYPAGDIRGTITTTGFTHVSFLDFGATNQNVTGAPVTSKGLGLLTLTGFTLGSVVSHSVYDPNVTAAHIHGTALQCQSSGIVFPYSVPNTQIVQNFNLTQQNINDMNNQLYYINVHSTQYPNGEVRGQIYPISWFVNNNVGVFAPGVCPYISPFTPTPTPTATPSATTTTAPGPTTTATPTTTSSPTGTTTVGPTGTTTTASPTGTSTVGPTSTPKPSSAAVLSASLVVLVACAVALL